MRCWAVGSPVLPPISLPLSPAIPFPNGASSSSSRGSPNAEDSSCIIAPPFPSFKWRLLIAYDGTRYAGWQYQRSPPTIQCLIEEALIGATKLERKDLHLVGASRTDKGVHAWGQVAHFITPFNYDSLESVHAALNGLLPVDIRVREISPAAPDFHARFSTLSKVYHYKIYNGAILDPFQRCYTYHCVYKLNYAAMKEAANYFVGKHDFSAFTNAAHNDRVGPLVQLEVEGSGFLYRQVRNMVGLLVQIGKEAIPPDVVPKILASQDRRELAKYASGVPPQGLCLVSINYKEDHLKLPSDCPGTSVGRNRSVSKCKLPFY
ncbi:tRNA pseudouridine synthase A 1 isoform X3 [Benincasa hispida]|uniref:tRNA pseudouridine synthase A 1 isoform X3 n=1 Tax=Benincasa hispida TaxID=102211 RepID=UPI001901A16F|nr:tRNA pseudouridine synthase A 1 isoform X3 [Benincasa hispida]